jgi:hypothetical protein
VIVILTVTKLYVGVRAKLLKPRNLREQCHYD